MADQANVTNITKVHHHSVGERERLKANGNADVSSPHSVLLMDAFNPPSSGDMHGLLQR